ncbi:MAG TPA: hypothetical protein VK550_09040 [Polyangiaceae bacterium]|jgi:hypothetical protein|nr:hypothetical protein [Polyangiaceae bacterium]
MGDTDNAGAELDELLDELDAVLKQPEIATLLTARGINTSLALLVADGLRAYLKGRKKEAAEDLGTAAEEIAARLKMAGGGHLHS